MIYYLKRLLGLEESRVVCVKCKGKGRRMMHGFRCDFHSTKVYFDPVYGKGTKTVLCNSKNTWGNCKKFKKRIDM